VTWLRQNSARRTSVSKSKAVKAQKKALLNAAKRHARFGWKTGDVTISSAPQDNKKPASHI